MATFTTIAVTSAAGCSGDPNSLTGGRERRDYGDGTNEQGAPPSEDGASTPAALQCTEKPQGRSYLLFDGTKLETSRTNENIGVNRARQKPYAVMAGEYQRVLGKVPASLAGAAGSFDDPPARWYAEAEHSGVSLSAIFRISFEGCTEYTKTAPEYAELPNTTNAPQVCSTLIRKAWSHSASPAELDGCVDLAVNKLGTEPLARRRWAYVCASVLSSSQFLTF